MFSNAAVRLSDWWSNQESLIQSVEELQQGKTERDFYFRSQGRPK